MTYEHTHSRVQILTSPIQDKHSPLFISTHLCLVHYIMTVRQKNSSREQRPQGAMRLELSPHPQQKHAGALLLRGRR
jgi:hypothetical protein